VALQLLAELKTVFKEDAGLELNISKTSILPKGTDADEVHRPKLCAVLLINESILLF
jgi:hypothetical protein